MADPTLSPEQVAWAERNRWLIDKHLRWERDGLNGELVTVYAPGRIAHVFERVGPQYPPHAKNGATKVIVRQDRVDDG